MSNYSTLRKWMTITLIFTMLVFAGLFFISMIWVPKAAAEKFGQPDDDLSNPRRLFLSIRLMVKEITKKEKSGTFDSPMTFQVISGTSALQIANDLEWSGIIKDAEYLSLYWEYRGFDKFIREGIYLLDGSLNTIEIGNNLVQGETDFTRFAFLPGWRKEEIDNLLISTGLSSNSNNTLLSDCFPNIDFEGQGIEGYLFPGEYDLKKDSSYQEIVCSFVDRFFTQISDQYLNEIEEKDLKLKDAVILASIIEKEVVNKSEAKKIAGVFLNRIKAGMPLQSDPTVQYAVASARGQAPWWESDLSKLDLEIESPFNTYINNDLPPAPICNPSLDALLAVAQAVEHDFYFFRAACDHSGSHVFSETYEQHLDAACD